MSNQPTDQPTGKPPTLRARLRPLTGNETVSAAIVTELAAWFRDRRHRPGATFVGRAVADAVAGVLDEQADRIRRGVDKA